MSWSKEEREEGAGREGREEVVDGDDELRDLVFQWNLEGVVLEEEVLEERTVLMS
jgi:hypothetical protein